MAKWDPFLSHFPFEPHGCTKALGSVFQNYNFLKLMSNIINKLYNVNAGNFTCTTTLRNGGLIYLQVAALILYNVLWCHYKDNGEVTGP